MELKEKLKILRKENNYTQEEIAKILNISSVGYGDYERGKSIPDIFTLKKLSILYKITLDEFMKETEDNNINIQISLEEKTMLENILKKINNSEKISNSIPNIATGHIIGENISIGNNYNKKIKTGNVKGSNIKIGNYEKKYNKK